MFYALCGGAPASMLGTLAHALPADHWRAHAHAAHQGRTLMGWALLYAARAHGSEVVITKVR